MAEWQSIETTPKDGTKVLLWCDGAVHLTHWWTKELTPLNAHLIADHTPQWSGLAPIGVDHPEKPRRTPQPTHWMPLPKGPPC